MRPGIRYHPGLFWTSIAIAIIASWAALGIAFTLRDNNQRHLLLKRFGAGLVMGVAIAGMHYTGMSASIFRIGSICGVSNGGECELASLYRDRFDTVHPIGDFACLHTG